MEVYIFSLRIEFTRTLYDHLERRRAVASLRGAPRVTPFRGYVTPEGKKLWANLQRIVEKRGRTGKNGVGWHWCDTDTRVKAIKSDSDSDSNEQKKKKRSSVFEKKKQGVTPQNWRLKKVARFFRKKIERWLAAQGVTHPSDATGIGMSLQATHLWRTDSRCLHITG